MSRKTRDVAGIKLWSEVVREYFGHACQRCGRAHGRMNAHHIIRRANYVHRYNPDNGLCLCVHCHVWGKTFSAHGTPEDFLAWFAEYDPLWNSWRIRHKNDSMKDEGRLFTSWNIPYIESEITKLKAVRAAGGIKEPMRD